VTTPPTIQTNPLDPVFSGVPVVISQGNFVNPTWNKWFVDLREKVNVINSTLAAWSGITPVTGLTPGTYGDATHYPIVTVNGFGLVTGITKQSVSGGGGAMHISNVSGDYTITSSDIPSTSSYVGMVIATSASANSITIDLKANTNIPVGAVLYVMQNGSGETKITGVTGTTVYGPSITGAGQYALGKAIQISADRWYISGGLAYIPVGNDPYWAYVVSLCHFSGTNGSTTITDQVSGVTWTAGTGTSISTAQYLVPPSSLLCGTGGAHTSGSIAAIGTQDFTFECFAYTSTSTSPQTLHKIGSSAPNFIINAGNIQFSNGSTWSISSGVSIPLNSWVHLAVSRTSGVMKMFIGGVQCFSGTVATSYSSGQLYIGADTASNYLRGYMAESRVTIGIGRYTASFTPPTVPFPDM
jgi:hypothetical protein